MKTTLTRREARDLKAIAWATVATLAVGQVALAIAYAMVTWPG